LTLPLVSSTPQLSYAYFSTFIFITILQQPCFQKRAFKEAQRNSNSANNEYLNAAAEGDERRGRIKEVHEQQTSCEELGHKVANDQLLLRAMIACAKVDVDCYHEMSNSALRDKEDSVCEINVYLEEIRGKTRSMMTDVSDNEIKFKNIDREVSRANEAVQQETQVLKDQISDINRKNLDLDRELHLRRGELITLEEKMSTLEKSGTTARDERDGIKKKAVAEKGIQDQVLLDLDGELETARASESACLEKSAKARNEENRLIILKDVLEKDAKDKENIIRGNSSDYTAKLKSLHKKISDFEKIEVDLRNEFEIAKTKVSDLEAYIANKKSELRTQEEEQENARRKLVEGKSKLQQLRGKFCDDEKETLAVEARMQKSKKNFEDEKSRLENEAMENRKIFERQDKEIEAVAIIIRQEIDRQAAADIVIAEKKMAMQQQEVSKKTRSVKQSEELASLKKVADEFRTSLDVVIGSHTKAQAENKALRDEIAEVEASTLSLGAIQLETMTSELKSKLLPSNKVKEIKANVQKSIECDKALEINIDKETAEVQKCRDSFESGKDELMAKAKIKNAEEMKKVEESFTENARAISEEKERPAESERLKEDIKSKISATEAEIEKDNDTIRACKEKEYSYKMERESIEAEIAKNEEMKALESLSEVEGKCDHEPFESKGAVKSGKKKQHNSSATKSSGNEPERTRVEPGFTPESEGQDPLVEAPKQAERLLPDQNLLEEQFEINKRHEDDDADSEVAERARAKSSSHTRKLEKKQRKKEAAKAAAAAGASLSITVPDSATAIAVEHTSAKSVALKKVEKKSRKSSKDFHANVKGDERSDGDGNFNFDEDDTFDLFQDGGGPIHKKSSNKHSIKKKSSKTPHAILGDSLNEEEDDDAFTQKPIRGSSSGKVVAKSQMSKKAPSESSQQKALPVLVPFDDESVPIIPSTAIKTKVKSKSSSKDERNRQEEKIRGVSRSRSPPSLSTSSSKSKDKTNKPTKATANETDWLFGMDDFSF